MWGSFYACHAQGKDHWTKSHTRHCRFLCEQPWLILMTSSLDLRLANISNVPNTIIQVGWSPIRSAQSLVKNDSQCCSTSNLHISQFGKSTPARNSLGSFYPKGSINPSADILGGFSFYLSGPPEFADRFWSSDELWAIAWCSRTGGNGRKAWSFLAFVSSIIITPPASVVISEIL
jgi:hypothetical protein